jgi:capsid protein
MSQDIPKKRFTRNSHQKMEACQTATPEQQFRFTAAEIARRDGVFVPAYATGEDAIKRDRELMVRLNRDQYMNSAPYRAIIMAFCGAVCGDDGIEFSPVAEPKTKILLQTLWTKWTNFADITGRGTFTDLERQIVTELAVVGEVLLVKRKGLALQIIESERIAAVLTDAQGAVTAVEVLDPAAEKGRITIKASDCIYVSLTDRPSQMRGAGILWSCCDVVSMLTYILRKSARAWGMAANYAIAIEADSAPEYAAMLAQQTQTDPETGEIITPTETDPLDGRSFQMDDAQMFFGRKGEKISTISHNGVPNVMLSEHVLTYLRIISSVVGFDAATAILSDFSQTNYSSSRAANLALSKTVSRFQNKLTYCLYDRIGRWLIGSWGVMGLLPEADSTEILDSVNWICPKPQVIDAKGEAQANQLELQLGLTTHNDLLLARNKSPEQYLAQRSAEIVRAVETAKLISEATGETIQWQTLCGMPLPTAGTAGTAGTAATVKEPQPPTGE